MEEVRDQERLRESRLEEVQLIRSSLTKDEFQWGRGSSEQEVAAWERLLEQQSSGASLSHDDAGLSTPPLSYRVKLFESTSATHAQLWMEVDIPSSVDREPQVSIYADPAFKKADVEEVKVVLRERWEETRGDDDIEHRIFDVLTLLQGHTADQPPKEDDTGQQSQTSKSATNSDTTTAAAAAAAKSSATEHAMLRVIFWSHHLLANSKRRDLNHWSQELSIWTVLKVGYPGYLCFEGYRAEVEEVVRRVKSLQWAAITVRSEVGWTYVAKPEDVSRRGADFDWAGEALLSCALAKGHAALANAVAKRKQEPSSKVRTGCQELESMKEIVERLRATGIGEDEVVEALGLRTSSKGT